MKKLVLILIACSSMLTASAQDSLKNLKTRDQQLPRWCLDVNYMGGVLAEKPTMMDLTNTKLYGANSFNQPSKLGFSNGRSNGGEASLGYFFGHSRMFGIGLGASVFSQTGNLTMDNFHVEYQSWDAVHRDSFRQIISSTKAIADNMTITNVNIPIMLKFKHQFSNSIGFNADLGGMVNVALKNSYSTNAAFNYEADYLTTDGHTYIYDNTQLGNNPNDWQITKANFLEHNPSQSQLTQYFDQKYANGYNVKLDTAVGKGTAPKNESINFGFIGRAAISYKLNYHIAIDLGGYYTYQMFKNSNNEKLTDKVGEYHSVNALISKNTFTSYGVNIGVRFYFGGFPDIDGDGVADKVDKCPYEPGLPEFQGCPDRDGDGVPDREDRCPDVKGSKLTAGCPDRDEDGVPDDIDQCPDVPGVWPTGCPDRDKDGVADDDDWCPDVPGLKQFHGCPNDTSLKSAIIATTGGTATAPTTIQPSHIVMSKNVLNF